MPLPKDSTREMELRAEQTAREIEQVGCIYNFQCFFSASLAVTINLLTPQTTKETPSWQVGRSNIS